MTQEDKELLLKDLCARLPYGVKVQNKSTYTDDGYITVFNSDLMYLIGVRSVKPYLRPMSSMTLEEKKEYDNLRAHICDDYNRYCFDTYKSIDWLNKKMFDYRGLIPMGLALEAKEGMYSLEN